jgi:starch-binding outer membrane protein, SusD/RagB family
MTLIKLKYIIPVLAGGLLLAGCKKERLNTVPQNSLSDAVAFGTADRIAQQVYGCYGATKNGNFLGGRAHVYNDVRGEDWLNVTNNNVTAAGVFNFNVNSAETQVEGLWAAGYAAINRINVVLQGIDANPGVIPASLATQYKAEVRFCRGLSYFHLVVMYGRRPYNADAGASPGLPLRLTANTSSQGTALARSTVAQVYAQILDDLNYAETNLPASYPAGDSNVVRAHKNAAIALKTRVLLSMGNYAGVITEGNKIVPAAAPFIAPTGVQNRLNANFVNVFRASYTTLESIFSFPMNNNNAPGLQNGLSLYHNAEFGLNTTAPGILTDPNWKTADARKTLVTTAFRYQKFTDDNNNWIPILRYAEVMLNLAEALARQASGVDARAVALLNAVRQRSDATTTFAPATKTELINLILNERRIEFLGEGLRAIDIQRQVLDFPARGSVAAVPSSSLSYVWPIPATELLYNSAMTPNN